MEKSNLGARCRKVDFFFLSDCIYKTFQRSKIESFVFHLILLSAPPTSSTARPRIVPLLRRASNTIGGLILLMVTLAFFGVAALCFIGGASRAHGFPTIVYSATHSHLLSSAANGRVFTNLIWLLSAGPFSLFSFLPPPHWIRSHLVQGSGL